jgi:hypothetical protein
MTDGGGVVRPQSARYRFARRRAGIRFTSAETRLVGWSSSSDVSAVSMEFVRSTPDFSHAGTAAASIDLRVFILSTEAVAVEFCLSFAISITSV